jgi:signal transduction histidine kinase
MQSAPPTDDEKERLKKLEEYAVLDTDTEENFDRITRIVAEVLGVPISLVSLVDESRQWFKSRHGLDATETPRELAFCAHAIHSEELFLVPNAKEDERFHDNPLVAGDPNIRFYAGAPLVTPDGYKIGTLCAIDCEPKALSDDHRQLLEDLASLVVDELELRKARREADEANAELRLKIDELIDSRNRLEQQAAEMTELAEQRSELTDRLSAEVALKDRFFSIIAHDLKSPFTSLLGMSQMMASSAGSMPPDKVGEYAQDIHGSAEKVFQLLEQLLEWARVQMEREQIAPETIDLGDIAEANIEVLSEPANEKSITVANSLEGVSAYADENMVILVVRNLLSNAIKFTPNDGSISISYSDRDGMVEVCVTDSGAGVDPSVADDLFSFDTKTTTIGTDGEQGTGLGLPLCRQMIELNGGELDFRPSAAGGTCFFFTLPKPEPN